jgi:hypothetical protein
MQTIKQTTKTSVMKSFTLLLAGAAALFIATFGAAGQGTLGVSTVGNEGPPAPPSLFSGSSGVPDGGPPAIPGVGDSGGPTIPSPDLVSAVPEPSPEILLAFGGLATLAYRRFQKRGQAVAK